MATAFDARWWLHDASGNGLSGALLYVYDAGTSSLSSIYSDAALTVPAANPLTADANGFIPQFYVAEGNLYDLKPTTSGGVTLNRDCLSVAGVGSQTGALIRDFTTSRFQARGAAGTTHIEAGDASPDNVGGTMRLGGWASTQADLITLDGASVNVTGRLKEQGFKLDGTVRQEAIGFSAAVSVAIPLTNDPTGVRLFEVDIIDFFNATATDNLRLTFSYDNGATYDTAASYLNTINFSEAAVTGGSGNVVAVAPPNNIIGVGLSMPANMPAAIRMSVVTPNSGNYATSAFGTIAANYQNSATTVTIQNFMIRGAASKGRATHIKLTGTGNLSGIYRVRPIRGFGEP